MSYETDLVALLDPVSPNEVWWLKMPDGHPVPDIGLLVLQQVGGSESWYVDQSRPGFQQARVQIAAWAPSALAAINLMRSARNLLATSGWKVQPMSNAIDQDLPVIGMFGRMQHFGIWYPDP